MKLTTIQLYTSVINMISGAMADKSVVYFDDEKIQKLIDIAQRTAALIPDTDPMPEPIEARKMLQQIFGEVDGRAISKTQLSNAIQTRMETGRRNAENIILWAETEQLIKAEARGNGINYTLA
jgi:hypothetical protein